MDVPKIVTDTTIQRWSRRRFLGGAVSVAALGSFATACGSGADRSASAPAPGVPASPPSGTSTSPRSTPATSGVDADLIRQRYQGLRPFAPAPPPPAVKPITLSTSDPTVFSHVPMTDKVVFVTIDDGIEKDPGFIQMVKDVQIPITISLADVLIRDDYAYFEKLYETGYISIQNHTVTHPLDMPGLPASRQLYEISGQQEKLRRQYGVTPYIFRPRWQLRRDDDRRGQRGRTQGLDALEGDHADRGHGLPDLRAPAQARRHHPLPLPRPGAASTARPWCT